MTWTFLGKVAGIAAAVEGISWLHRMHQRNIYFAKATAISHSRGRPLMVVGKPFGWDSTRNASSWVPWSRCGAHPCADGSRPSLGASVPPGSVTVDIRGVPECEDGLAADITDLRQFPDGYFGAVYVSCTLEHVEDAPKAWSELHRVSTRPGEKPAVFVIHPQAWSWFAYFEPSHKWIIAEAKDGTFRGRPVRK